PTDAPENGYRETPIRCRSRTAIFIRSAPISTRHRANASASKRRQKCSSRSCWRPADEATTLPWLPVALQLELTSGCNGAADVDITRGGTAHADANDKRRAELDRQAAALNDHAAIHVAASPI